MATWLEWRRRSRPVPISRRSARGSIARIALAPPPSFGSVLPPHHPCLLSLTRRLFIVPLLTVGRMRRRTLSLATHLLLRLYERARGSGGRARGSRCESQATTRCAQRMRVPHTHALSRPAPSFAPCSPHACLSSLAPLLIVPLLTVDHAPPPPLRVAAHRFTSPVRMGTRRVAGAPSLTGANLEATNNLRATNHESAAHTRQHPSL